MIDAHSSNLGAQTNIISLKRLRPMKMNSPSPYDVKQWLGLWKLTLLFWLASLLLWRSLFTSSDIAFRLCWRLRDLPWVPWHWRYGSSAVSRDNKLLRSVLTFDTEISIVSKIGLSWIWKIFPRTTEKEKKMLYYYLNVGFTIFNKSDENSLAANRL